MHPWQEDHVQVLISHNSEDSLFEGLITFAHALEFDFCAYGIRSPLPVTRPRTIMFNNYPENWQKLYKDNGYLEIDPSVQQGLKSQQPIIWTDDLFVNVPEFWDNARSFGLQVGWAQSIRGAHGVTGMLTLSRSGEILSESEINSKQLKILWLAQVAHMGMMQHMATKIVPGSEVHLSAREVSVLRWTADGKTSGEIATILGITERTVNFHINNAIVKLGVSNKLAAAVRATVLGLLY